MQSRAPYVPACGMRKCRLLCLKGVKSQPFRHHIQSRSNRTTPSHLQSRSQRLCSPAAPYQGKICYHKRSINSPLLSVSVPRLYALCPGHTEHARGNWQRFTAVRVANLVRILVGLAHANPQGLVNALHLSCIAPIHQALKSMPTCKPEQSLTSCVHTGPDLVRKMTSDMVP